MRTLFPLTAFKNTPNTKTTRTPNLSKICPYDCFWGFQSGGLNFVKKICQTFEKRQFRTNFDKFLTNFSPPDWNPQKQSQGQILDKFGVRGVFECCTLVTEMIVTLILPEFVTCNVNLRRVIITQLNSSENYSRVIDYTLALCTWMRTCLVMWTALEPQRRS